MGFNSAFKGLKQQEEITALASIGEMVAVNNDASCQIKN